LPVDVQTPSVKRRRVTGGLATPAPSSEGGDVVPDREEIPSTP
jgi:hypothetical protein